MRKANKLVILLTLSLISPLFSFAQQPKITLPKTLLELPEILEKIWQENILPAWQKLKEWLKENVWQKGKDLFKNELETRKPIIEAEFQQEKEELKEKFPKLKKALWERVKELINRFKIKKR